MKMPSLGKKNVSIGYTGIELVDEKDLDKNQVGYSNLPNGESLIGKENGDWKKDWVVIGYETGCGDPIFIDTSDPNFPVYTALHGEGNWNPNLISSTYHGFLQIIEKLKILATDREYPTKMEEKPMTQKEYDEFILFASDRGGLESAFFWELLVSDDNAGIGPEI